MFFQVAILLLAFGLAGCAPPPASHPAENSLAPPQRILSLSSAATSILLQLDYPPAAIDHFGGLVPGAENLPVIGKGSAISREKLAELQIDCVLLWYYQSSVAADLRSAGLRVEIIPPLRLDNYPDLLSQLGSLTNRLDAARQLRAAYGEQLQKAQTAMTDQPPVLVCLELYGPGKIAGDQSYAGDLLRFAGGISINRDRSGLLSPERIVEAAPQILFFIEGHAEIAELSARPAYAATPAVQAGRVYSVPRQLLVEGLAPLEAIAFLYQKIHSP